MTELKLIFSKHASEKIRERKIKVKMIEKVLKNPEILFYDLVNKTMIAVAKVKVNNTSTNLVVVFTKEGEKIKIVTTYACKNIRKEIKRKDGIRWVRV